MPEEPLPPLRRPQPRVALRAPPASVWSRAEASPGPRSSWSLCRAPSRAGARSRRVALLAAGLPLCPPPLPCDLPPSPGRSATARDSASRACLPGHGRHAAAPGLLCGTAPSTPLGHSQPHWKATRDRTQSHSGPRRTWSGPRGGGAKLSRGMTLSRIYSWGRLQNRATHSFPQAHTPCCNVILQCPHQEAGSVPASPLDSWLVCDLL